MENRESSDLNRREMNRRSRRQNGEHNSGRELGRCRIVFNERRRQRNQQRRETIVQRHEESERSQSQSQRSEQSSAQSSSEDSQRLRGASQRRGEASRRRNQVSHRRNRFYQRRNRFYQLRSEASRRRINERRQLNENNHRLEEAYRRLEEICQRSTEFRGYEGAVEDVQVIREGLQLMDEINRHVGELEVQLHLARDRLRAGVRNSVRLLQRTLDETGDRVTRARNAGHTFTRFIQNVERNLPRFEIHQALRGLTEDALSRLQERRFEGQRLAHTECSICLETFKASENLTKLDCGHEFHSDCIKRWLREHSTCCLCRKQLSN